MANMRIISNVDFDSATLTSSPACGANTPVTNLQVGLRAKVARVTGTSWAISGVYPSAKLVSAVSLYKHNFSSSATMSVKLYSDAALTGQIGSTYTANLGGVAKQWGVDFAIPAGWGNGGEAWGGVIFDAWPASYFTLWLPAAVAGVMGFKIEIADTGGSSYLEIGRVYMGAAWSPAVNCSYGLTMAWQEQSKQFRTDGGSLRTEGNEPFRTFNFQLDTLTAEERATLVNLFRKLGLRKDFFVSFFPTAGGDLETDYTAAVKITNMPAINTPYFNNYATDSIQIQEV